MLIVGIAGGTGSGKTTLVSRLLESLPDGEITVIPQDSYYRDNRNIEPSERQKINFDHPDSVDFNLLISHLRTLRAGMPVEMPCYSYLTCLRSQETVTIKPSRIIIVEGILVLADEGLRDNLDIKVYLDADPDDRLGRIIERDLAERGRSVTNVLERYHETVKPSHLRFIEPSKKYADIIIHGGGESKEGLEKLLTIVGSCLPEDKKQRDA